ncbi:Rrf2 family transcriptional regulator [Haploplasma axanthum]|uniref:HTH-type transcriptional regulator ywnA n=1 Tax=Haploplasma axanthum TaxID=29552 RepID=A0A449BDL7_HAPAX|nr:Rrf2 family transcriptional regulator [Haploplasma axanthum]VEU80551.1 Putative HTH-type transcriptional regulator ywnA [Haploplasma axanthum]
MQVNQNFGVAIHLLSCLSEPTGEYKTSAYLAESVNTNPVVVRRILKVLENNGLVETKKGKFGSRLSKDPQQITFYDVYKTFFDGNILQPSHHPNKACPVGNKITGLISNVLSDATTKFENTLKEYTIANMKKEIEKGE